MDTKKQRDVLDSYDSSFADKLVETFPNADGLTAVSIKNMQINMGRLCNQACRHCHVEGSPDRVEIMSRETVDQCLRIIADVDEIETVDLTGGAPELNENFTHLVRESRALGKSVIDRSNLTVLEADGNEYLYEFLPSYKVHIVASLPHFVQSEAERMRGSGVFETSITALKKLNAAGYGSDLPLTIVYNPGGLFLSGPQKELEREFKRQLKEKHGVRFTDLICINNFPIGRFLQALQRMGKFESYMDLLVSSYNLGTIEGLMCRHQMSVGHDGHIYDCDFNQMLDITAQPISHVRDFDYKTFINRRVQVANHCFACTAGVGSSCAGAIDNSTI
jgi:radical SAM/Cys-rich protein